MSRSRRRIPKRAWSTANTEAPDKRRAWKRFRGATRRALLRGDDAMPQTRRFFNPWLTAKDGKGWFDPEEYPRFMRK